ncbi:SPOR domain-containing protein [Thalassiella azotivora]
MAQEYWFNVETQQVEEGHQSDWRNLLGPYRTREEAQQALQTARENTERWDAEDRAWEGDDDA